MSYFDNLSSTSQSIIMIQFEFLGKIIILGSLLLGALFLIFFYNKIKKDPEKNPYILSSLIFKWLNYLSYIYIFFLPLFIIFLYPQIAIDKVMIGLFAFYRYAVWIIGILFFVNIFIYTPLIVAKLSGVKFKNKKLDILLTHFMGKNKKFFIQNER